MSVEEVGPYTFQVFLITDFFFCHSKVTQSVNLGQVASVLDHPFASAQVSEQVLLGSKHGLSEEHFANWELPLLSKLIAHEEVGTVLRCVVN